MDRKNVSLNLNVRGLGTSATLAINDRSNALIKQGRKICKLGLGQSPFPVPDVIVKELKQRAHEKSYLPVKGLPELRNAVADFHRRKDHIDAHEDGVLIGPGSKELMFLLQLVYYGEIILPTPCWVSYVPQAKIIGRNVRIIHTSFEDKWRISAEQIERLVRDDKDMFRPRLLVLNYPGNPDGDTYGEQQLRDIADVARKYEIILLSDEIYGQLHHRGAHVSIARFYPERTIVSSGLSKWCGAGGWRLGTFTFPSDLHWLLDAMANVASETYTSVSAPIQYAAVRAFAGHPEIEIYLWHVRRILSRLGQRCADMLFQAGIRVHKPEGAFYLFLDFEVHREALAKKGITTGRELCERLLDEAGVAILPGADFERPESELTARLAYVNFDGAAAIAASKTEPLDQPLSEGFVRRWCFDTIEAMERICAWITTER